MFEYEFGHISSVKQHGHVTTLTVGVRAIIERMFSH